MVLAHARALLTSTPEGATAYLDADLREPDKILAGAADLLEFRQPVAVLLIGILQLIPAADDPHAIVARLIQAVSPGSWLAVYHPASGIDQQQVATFDVADEMDRRCRQQRKRLGGQRVALALLLTDREQAHFRIRNAEHGT